MAASAKGVDGMRATLMTRHRRLGYPPFNTAVVLAENGAGGMVIMDLPKKIHGLNACAGIVAAKSVHLPHKEEKSCKSVPGSSPHRHSGANAHEIGWWTALPLMITVGRCTCAHCDSSRTHQKPPRYSKLRLRMNPRKDVRSHDGQHAQVEYRRDEADLQARRN